MQPNLLAMLTPDEELDENIVLVGDSRFWDVLKEFETTKIFGLDIETYGAAKDDALNPWKGFIRLIQIALPSRKVLIVDLGGNEYKPCLYPNKYRRFAVLLQQKLFDKSVVKVGHNLKFDLVFIRTHTGYIARNVRDTMLMSQIYWSGVGVSKAAKGESRAERCKLPHTLKGVAERLGLGEVDKTEQTSNWGDTLSNKQLNYAAKDALVVLDIHDILKNKLIEEGLGYSIAAECLFLPVLTEIEYRGFPVDTELLDTAISKYEQVVADIVKPWYAEFPSITHTATKRDTVPALNEKYRLSLEKADDEALSPLAHQYPAMQALLDYRSLNISLKYLMSVRNKMFDGAIRGKYTQIAQGWRTSCKNPNLQQAPNLPKKFAKLGLPSVKSIFKPPAGYSLLIHDLSAAHARIATQVTGCKALVAGYCDNRDNHVRTAARVLRAEGKTWTEEEVEEIYISSILKSKQGVDLTEDEIAIVESRKRGKIGFYAYLNMAGIQTFVQTFAGWGISITEDYARLLKGALRDVYGDLEEYILQVLFPRANSYSFSFEQYNDRTGKPLTGTYGMHRGLTGGRNFFLKQKSKFNKELQVPLTDMASFTWLSAEASMLKTASGYILQGFDEHPEWDGYICNYVHDETNSVCLTEYVLEVSTFVGETIKAELEKFIKVIPVVETTDWSKNIVEDWSQK